MKQPLAPGLVITPVSLIAAGRPARLPHMPMPSLVLARFVFGQGWSLAVCTFLQRKARRGGRDKKGEAGCRRSIVEEGDKEGEDGSLV